MRSLPAILSMALLCTGCGGYASTSEAFRRSLTRGQPEDALKAVDEALGVDRPEQLPSEQTADTPLLLIERATILQALTDYELSSRDFQLADKQLEVLDLTSDTSGSIAKYLYSDDATVYKGPPHEKLLINTLNLINYLARGELSGAKVEARRFTVNRKYFDDRGDGGRGLMALGSYLAGFAFEMAGESGAAMRHYGDAADAGGLPVLKATVSQLAARSGETDPRLKALIDGRPAPDDEGGELLIIVQTGMAPYRVPERLPIGAAVVYATAPGPGARLSAADQRRANTFAAKGLLKWINIPGLKGVKRQASWIHVDVDGRSLDAPVGLDITARVVEEFDRAKGSLIAASITRMITRAVAGELTQAAASKKNSSGLGLLLGLAVEGAMTAADTPDTRGWVTLPAEVRVARTRLPPGRHTIEVAYKGVTQTDEIEMKKNGWAVLNFSALR